MKYEDFKSFIAQHCCYEAIYDDSEGRTILVMRLLDAYAMVNKAQPELKFQNYGWWRDENGKLQCGTIPQDRSALPLLRPGEFCKFVEGKEDFRGFPVVMSVWPTQEEK